MTSSEPILVSLFENLIAEASIKFHKEQFKRVLTNVVEKEHTEYVTSLKNADRDGAQNDD